MEQEVGTGAIEDAVSPNLKESVSILHSGLYCRELSVFEVKSVPQTGGSSSYGPSQSPPQFKVYILHPGDSRAEKGSNPILYTQDEKPFDLNTYCTAKNQAHPPHDVPEELHRMYQLTLHKFVKRRLYTDNILLNIATLLESYVLRRHIAIEDLRLQFHSAQQRTRITTDGEIAAAAADAENIELLSGSVPVTGHTVGRLFLHSTLTGTWAY